MCQAESFELVSFVRGEVVKAGREALGSRGARRSDSSPPPSRGFRERALRSFSADQGFKLSFAELLKEHLPEGTESGEQALPKARSAGRSQKKTVTQTDPQTELRLRVAQAERARDQALHQAHEAQTLSQKQALQLKKLQNELSAFRGYKSKCVDLENIQIQRKAEHDQLEENYSNLNSSHAHLLSERTLLIHQVQGLEDACEELQRELKLAQEALENSETEQARGEAMLEELESAMQREMAWRARALELERVAQAGGNLPGLLQSIGIKEFAQQAQVLMALLKHRDTALPLIRAIRQVDAKALERMVAGRIRQTCAHPICNQVSRAQDRVILRVAQEESCEICGGSEERRWFARMVEECKRSGIRRLLIVGGGAEIHKQLRSLSQGQPVDLRLVLEEDEAHSIRIQGRVEGCDLLLLWSAQICAPLVSASYAQRARRERRMTVKVLGERPLISNLAKAVANRLARSHILVPL